MNGNPAFDAKPIALVIFDMDGVIADTKNDHKRAWRDYLSRWDRDLSDREFDAIFGRSNEEILPDLLGHLNLNDEKINSMGQEKEALYRKTAQLITFPGFFEFLDLLERLEVPKAVGSSGNRDNVDFILSGLELEQRFLHTVSGDDVKNAKPAPDIFLKVARLCGVSPQECLVVEDSVSGITAAKAAGMRVAALSTTRRPDDLTAADRVLSDFYALADLLEPLLRARQAAL